MDKRRVGRIVLALFFFAGGAAHFLVSHFFVAIVPPSLPSPLLLVYISGVAELLGAIGVLIPRTQRVAGLGLIALSVAVFPANLHMALNPDQFPQFAQWLLYARLPLQLVIIGGIYWCSVSPLSRIRWMFRRPL
jgi:uncharacterized membrane protein